MTIIQARPYWPMVHSFVRTPTSTMIIDQGSQGNRTAKPDSPGRADQFVSQNEDNIV